MYDLDYLLLHSGSIMLETYIDKGNKKWKKNIPLKKRCNRIPSKWNTRNGKFWKCIRLIHTLKKESWESYCDWVAKYANLAIEENLIKLKKILRSLPRSNTRYMIGLYLNVQDLRDLMNDIPDF